MRILLISPCMVPVEKNASAGIEVVLYALSHALFELGKEVHIVAEDSSITPRGVTLHTCSDANFSSEVSRILKRLRPDVICNHSCRSLGDYEQLENCFSVYHVARRYQQSDSKDVNVAFVSGYLRKLFEDERGRKYKDARVVKNGVLGNFPSPPIKDRGCDAASPYIAYIGRINRNKGINIAAEACRKLRIELRIFGGFGFQGKDSKIYNDITFLREIISEYGTAARYFGRLSCEQEKQKVLSSAVALAVPSLEPESCSLVALEAALFGTPVAAICQGGIGEYIGDWLSIAPRGNVAASKGASLASALRSAVRQGRRKPIDRNAYSSRAMAERYLAWWGSRDATWD